MENNRDQKASVDNLGKLSPEEARMLIKAIEEVEREEADAQAHRPSDAPQPTDC